MVAPVRRAPSTSDVWLQVSLNIKHPCNETVSDFNNNNTNEVDIVINNSNQL